MELGQCNTTRKHIPQKIAFNYKRCDIASSFQRNICMTYRVLRQIRNRHARLGTVFFQKALSTRVWVILDNNKDAFQIRVCCVPVPPKPEKQVMI
eukprot:162307-Amphidinium_carterae.1